ncbi:MAG TPA: peroxidase [Candidatus Marinimicrobia bacterium]|nr:MAG: hypothetical protein AUJ47_10680 [Candidatus Marinimicrobia bacterium CG1_02_48_14]PIZ63370.1 MAG: peroxidase [Candidatus Marinimicrobia bacterium CG_4_10_14_0_2_um_filter_48_9]PJA54548.1 MAG: peroxidase [Candidatus Marinimicrobia bacterium CG_4_9_14_3_um_filter_48_9]HCW76003.1 peroxidase [Candidatus Neomarinimicrobiota bacterium]
MLSSKNVSSREQDELISQLVESGSAENLSETDQAILMYVAKLTRTPGSIISQDVEILKSADLDDRAIHDICAIAAYFSFVNRMADGLGVELEDRFHSP